MSGLCKVGARQADAIIRRQMDLLERVNAYIRRYGLLTPGQHVLIGVSGGADSLALLDLLCRLGYRPVVAHLDHRLRPGSWRDAQFVLRVAAQRGLPSVLVRHDVRQSRRPGHSLEEVAREVRYRFLLGEALSRRLDRVAVAHTADDQAETILMHLLRGAGPPGLRGMRPAASLSEAAASKEAGNVVLIRPLLEITRSETTAHCAAGGLRPRTDPTNLDTSYFRNRLRHHLLPVLETYNPEVRAVLCRMGEVMAGEVEWTEHIVDEAWPSVSRPAGPQAVALVRQPFACLPVGTQRAILRRAVGILRPGLRDVGFEAIERAVRFAAGDAAGRRASTAGGLELLDLGSEVILREPGGAVTFPALPQLPDGQIRPLKGANGLSLAEGWSLEGKRSSTSKADLERLASHGTPNEIAVDADRVRGRLLVRPPLPGDRLRILGSQGTSEVADVFINAHIPWPARRLWPVVADGDRIVWIAGLRMSHDYRLTPGSLHVIHLRLVPPRRQEA